MKYLWLRQRLLWRRCDCAISFFLADSLFELRRDHRCTSQGKVFDMCLAYPFANKQTVDGIPFRERKMSRDHYGDDLARAVSLKVEGVKV